MSLSQKWKKEDDEDDYERKYKLKNIARLEEEQILHEQIKHLSIEEQNKIKEEKRKERDVLDFLEIDRIDKKKISKNEKLLKGEEDFIALANGIAALLNQNEKTPTKYQSSFFKETIDHLGPTLDLKIINDFLKELNKLFNEKRNKEAGKKKGTKKPKLAAGKAFEGIAAKPVKEYDYEDEYEEEYEGEYTGK